MSTRIHAVLLAALFGVLLAAAPAALGQPSTTWYVDDDAPPGGDGSAANPFDTIQEGIDAAAGGDTVLVADGAYTGDGNRVLNYHGKAITVMSENGPANCVIDCEGAARGFIFNNEESNSAVVDGFAIIGGHASGYGGAIYCGYESSPTIRNCIIAGCLATGNGGAVYCSMNAEPPIVNCAIAGNTAGGNGGGVFYLGATTRIVNSTIVGNTAAGSGGGVYTNWYRHLTIVNCILSGNTATSGPEARVSDGSMLTISYSDVDGGQAEIDATGGTLNWGDGMIDVDPEFVDPAGGDYHLSPGSLCIDAGTNDPVGGLPPNDVDGNPRPIDGDGNVEPWTGVAETADMGAYEQEAPVSPAISRTPEAFSFHAPQGEPTPDDQVLSIWNGGVGTLNWEIVEYCSWLSADPNSGDSTGEVDDVVLSVDAAGLAANVYECVLEIVDPNATNSPVTVTVTLYVYAPEDLIRFVDDDAPPGGDGRSWITARIYLQDALADATGDPNVNEIRVAGGVYKPDEGGSVTPHDRNETFQLLNDVAIRGGYRGLTGGGDPGDRDIVAFETILSGHDSSYHVVTGSGTDETAVLDGCTVADGYGTTYYPYPDGGPKSGAGIYISEGSPTITYCTIRDNRAGSGSVDYDWAYPGANGGGVFCENGAPTFMHCIVQSNRAGSGGSGICITGVPQSTTAAGRGGGLYFVNSTPVLIDCEIVDNWAGAGGGGASCEGGGSNGGAGGHAGGIGITGSASNALIIDCAIGGNSAGRGGSGGAGGGPGGGPGANGGPGGSGGGVCLLSSAQVLLVNCTIVDNAAAAGGDGGAAYYDGGNGGNGGCGGGVYVISGCQADLANCLVAGNVSGNGGDGGTSGDFDPGSGGDAGSGAGVHCAGDSVALANCTIAANICGQLGTGDPDGAEALGGGVYGGIESTTLANCILWANESAGTTEEQQLSGTGVTVDYSCIQGWTGSLGGSGNIGDDPQFVDPDTADYHLTSGSLCIDAGDNTAVPADEADVDDDGDTTERVPLDLDGLARFVDDPNTADTGVADPPEYPYVVDMGAYEYQGEFCFGDLDGDDDVDLSDLATLLANYGMTSGAAYEDGDLDADGDVDLSDLAALLAVYGTTCP